MTACFKRYAILFSQRADSKSRFYLRLTMSFLPDEFQTDSPYPHGRAGQPL